MSSTKPTQPHGLPRPDVTERLFARFEGRLSLTTTARVVGHCRRELDIRHGTMLPEMLERLAHLAGQAADSKYTEASATGDHRNNGTHTTR